MPHYLKSQTVDKLGFRSVPSYTVAGTESIPDGGTIDCTKLSGHVILLQTSPTKATDFYLENYTPGVVLHFTVKIKVQDIILHAPIGGKVNNGSIIKLNQYSSNSTSLFIQDSTNAYSTGG